MRYCAVPILATIMLLSIGGGCNRGNGLDQQAVSGKVTLDSRPLDNGTIQFTPTDKQGLLSGSSIVAGEYRIPKEKGLPPGKYTVQISSGLPGSAIAPVGPPGFVPPPLKERIPEKYNSMSQLSVEVKSGGDNTFDFDLNGQVGHK
jgi:hypothetical protein